MPTIRECDLPGIGKKFQVETRSGEQLVIVVHDDGRREMYHFDPEDAEESISMVSLDDGEARQVAGIIGGMAYKPRALESVEVALEDDLVIEWFKVEPAHKSVGQTIGDLAVREKSGATVIAVIEKNNQKKISPGPDHLLTVGATVVVAAERQQVKAFKQLLINGSE